jgi:hypothetical protein
MASLVYASCAAASITCAALLFARFKQRRERLLLWSAASFGGLAVNNVLLMADFVFVPTIDLSIYRSISAAGSVLLLLLGLIWDGR